MKRRRHSQKRISIAFFAGCLLLFQTLLAGFGMGSSHAGPMLDAFGNPICLSSQDSSPYGPAGRKALPDCCTVACGMFAPAVGDGREPHSLLNPLSASTPAATQESDTVFQAFVLGRWPGSPRAPPSLA